MRRGAVALAVVFGVGYVLGRLTWLWLALTIVLTFLLIAALAERWLRDVRD
jgi:hypothetical protein